MTKRIKLPINKYSYFIINYNFDITKYINGDINVEFYFQNKKMFTHLTQIKYFVDLLLNMIDLCLKQNVALEYPCNFNLLDSYFSYLNDLKSDNCNVECKTLFDLDDTGYITFLYWQKDQFYVEVNKTKFDIDNNENYYCEMVIKLLLQNEYIMEWVNILNHLAQKIGTKL